MQLLLGLGTSGGFYISFIDLIPFVGGCPLFTEVKLSKAFKRIK